MTVNLENLSVKQLYRRIADLTHERDELQRNAHELAIEGNHMRTAIAFATAPDMWVEQHDGMLDYRYTEWYVDVLNAALEAPSTDITIAEIEARGMANFVPSDEFLTELIRASNRGNTPEQWRSSMRDVFTKQLRKELGQ